LFKTAIFNNLRIYKITIPYLPLSFRRVRKFSVGKKSSLTATNLRNIIYNKQLNFISILRIRSYLLLILQTTI